MEAHIGLNPLMTDLILVIDVGPSQSTEVGELQLKLWTPLNADRAANPGMPLKTRWSLHHIILDNLSDPP